MANKLKKEVYSGYTIEFEKDYGMSDKYDVIAYIYDDKGNRVGMTDGSNKQIAYWKAKNYINEMR